ncbi:MAG: hypothetical protein Q9216_006335, partial [Gyalolechia sp. 2 TL-2023]
FGRQAKDYPWPDANDIRVPKIAFKIFFYRANLDADLDAHPDLDWRADTAGLQACISTQTSQFIHVNGVRLSRGRNNLFGYLRTGDVITVFQPEPGADEKALRARERERLMFRVEIFVGVGRQRRGEGDFFQVLDRGEMGGGKDEPQLQQQQQQKKDEQKKEKGGKRSREGSKGSEASKASKTSKTSKTSAKTHASPGHNNSSRSHAKATTTTTTGGDADKGKENKKKSARHSHASGQAEGSRKSGGPPREQQQQSKDGGGGKNSVAGENIATTGLVVISVTGLGGEKGRKKRGEIGEKEKETSPHPHLPNLIMNHTPPTPNLDPFPNALFHKHLLFHARLLQIQPHHIGLHLVLQLPPLVLPHPPDPQRSLMAPLQFPAQKRLLDSHPGRRGNDARLPQSTANGFADMARPRDKGGGADDDGANGGAKAFAEA